MLLTIILEVQKANTATARILNTTAVCSAYIHPPTTGSVSIEKTNRTPRNTAKLIVVVIVGVVVVIIAVVVAVGVVVVVVVGVVVVINPFRV